MPRTFRHLRWRLRADGMEMRQSLSLCLPFLPSLASTVLRALEERAAGAFWCGQ